MIRPHLIEGGTRKGEDMRNERKDVWRYDWMTDDQHECAALLADLYDGDYNVPGKIKEHDFGIRCCVYGPLCSFDCDRLTRLVVLGHDRCIRVEIGANGGPGRVELILHKRHTREGRMHERHPTLENAAVLIRMSTPPFDTPATGGAA